ncbi:hypothetical protein JCM11641_003589 [Rhodosporidiobolus odoratus]
MTRNYLLRTARSLPTHRPAARFLSSSSPQLAPANSHVVVDSPPTVANSKLLQTTREDALWTPDLLWRDEEQVGVGFPLEAKRERELKEGDLRAEDEGGRATEKMNAKYRYRSGGMFDCGSLTFRSQAYQQPSLPAAIRDPNPTLFLEPKILYRSAVEQVPTGDYELPLCSAEVLRQGKDLTIISYGPPLYTIEGALHLLKYPSPDLEKLIPKDLRNLSVELIDLRTIIPYDLAYEKFYLPDHVRILDGIIETMRY